MSQRRKSLLARIWRKLFPANPKPPVAVAAPKKRPVRGAGIEPLEGRIAPAMLMNASTVVFSDLEGDTVTVTFSKPLFTEVGSALATNLEAVFEFGGSTGAHSDFLSNGPQELQQIDLTKVAKIGTFNPATGVSITITAFRSSLGGNDAAYVGAIKADALPLGTVTIPGDLGQIDCGVAGSAVGLRALKVASLGVLTQTQTGAADFESRIVGALGSLTVAGDVNGFVHAVNGTGSANRAIGKIGNVMIGGVLGAGDATRESAGFIQAQAEIGMVKILGGVDGGSGKNSGAIMAGTNLVSVTLGRLAGGTGEGSGGVSAGGKMGTVQIAGDVSGGDGLGSGAIKAGSFNAVSVGGDLEAGKGAGSGRIFSSGALGAVKISGDVDASLAGAGANAGTIAAAGRVMSVAIDGSVIGGAGVASGSIQALGELGAVKIGGHLFGGNGSDSGAISSGGRMIGVAIAGGVTGGGGLNSGAIFGSFITAGGAGAVRVMGAVTGGSGDGSGAIVSGGALGLVEVGTLGTTASVAGGAGDFSGAIFASGALGSVKLGGDLAGGAGASSGTITARGKLSSVTLAGSILGGAGAGSGAVVTLDAGTVAGEIGRLSAVGLKGGAGGDSGAIRSAGKIGSVALGALTGTGAITSGVGLLARGDVGAISLGLLGGMLEINGSLRTLTAGEVFGAEIHVAGSLAVAQVAGSLSGTTLTVAGEGGAASLGRLGIGGDVALSQVLVGYNTARLPVNASAFIGAVTVKGGWTASDLVAGVRDVEGDGFGDTDDMAIGAGASRIASVIIGGAVAGTAAAGDRFGFVAQQIGVFQHGTTRLGLAAGAGGQAFEIAGDVSVREV